MKTFDGPVSGWLFVLPWSPRYIGGVNQVVTNLIQCFREGGIFSPQLLVSGYTKQDMRIPQIESLEVNYIDIWSPIQHEHPFGGLRSFILRFPYRSWKLSKIVKNHSIKVINPHFPNLGCLLFVLMRDLGLFKGKVILSFHGSDIRSVLATRGIELGLWRILLRLADHVVVVSKSLAKDVLAVEPRVAKTLTVNYNGVDVRSFASADQAEQQSKRAKVKTIVSVGSFVQGKGHDVLIRAFSHVTGKIPETRLLIIGRDGPEIGSIHQLIDSLSLSEKVAIYTNVPHQQIPGFLREASVFALASRAEGFGLVVVEAAAMKLPVVCTDTTGLRELITDGITGRLVEIDNDVALADAIVELLVHPEDAQKMAWNFYHKVRTELTWERTYETYIQLARPAMTDASGN